MEMYLLQALIILEENIDEYGPLKEAVEIVVAAGYSVIKTPFSDLLENDRVPFSDLLVGEEYELE
ncbi:hypothetical protein FACS1894110_14640 [Spirochaetia bacterium]|nr:hypothetical protein FACS1894110_14640 [Spirochaetia bacterium]